MLKDEYKVYEEKMKKSIEAVMSDFDTVRAGRANASVLNRISVDYYGTPTPIPQVAKVTVPEPRMLLVTPWEKTMVEPINRAIQMANIGVSPIMDGNGIRVAIPILTAERRAELVKIARKHAEEGKVAIRNIRRDANDAIKKNKELGEDESKKRQDQIQKVTDSYIAKVDEILKVKEADLLEV